MKECAKVYCHKMQCCYYNKNVDNIMVFSEMFSLLTNYISHLITHNQKLIVAQLDICETIDHY